MVVHGKAINEEFFSLINKIYNQVRLININLNKLIFF